MAVSRVGLLSSLQELEVNQAWVVDSVVEAVELMSTACLYTYPSMEDSKLTEGQRARARQTREEKKKLGIAHDSKSDFL